MANVTFNSIVSSTGTAGNFKASEMWSSHATYTGNFNAVTDQVNGNLNSINYSVSGFQSSNIAKNAILSQHITNNAVLSDKIGDGAIINAHMNYDISNSAGARVLRCGKAGLKYCRVSKTESHSVTDTSPTSTTIEYIWSNTNHNIDGNPGFTATPTLLANPIVRGPAPGGPYKWWKIRSINSVSAVLEFSWAAHVADRTDTHELIVAGF